MKATKILIGLALVASAALAETTPAADAKASDPVIITAGNITVHQSEFEAAIKSLPAEYQGYALGPGKKQFADDYLRMKLLAAEGMKNGLQNDPDVISQLNLMRENLVANAEMQKLDKAITVSDADLQKAYDAKKSEYEQVKASHILIAFKGSRAAKEGNELTDEQAKAKAEALRAKLVAGGDFAAAAKENSDDSGSATRGGELGTFGHGQMVPEFEKAAFETKPGEISPVIRTQYGYHIIKVQERTTTPFAQVKESLEKDAKQKELQAKVDAIKAAANPTYNSAYFAAPAKPEPAEGAAPAAKPATDAKPAAKPATPAPKKK